MWQRKGSVPLHYKTLLDYSVNLEPKSFAVSNIYAGHGRRSIPSIRCHQAQ